MDAPAKISTFCEKKEDNELLKVEMTPLQVASGQTEPTVVAISSEQLPERDHIVWSIFNTIYMNFCCLGFLALIFSVKARDQKLVGNGARRYSTTARYLNIFSTALTILWFVISVSVIIYNLARLRLAIRSEKTQSSTNPTEAVYVNQVNYGFNPHGEALPANVAMYPATSTVVAVSQDISLIKDHILWSIFSTIYMNCCCLGFTALVYSVKSRDRKLVGDHLGARNYSGTARKLNIATTTLAILWLCLMIILMATGTLSVRTT
ncbi:uncharacterized protein PAF06_015483 [Gastrophryne carolinensis]